MICADGLVAARSSLSFPMFALSRASVYVTPSTCGVGAFRREHHPKTKDLYDNTTLLLAEKPNAEVCAWVSQKGETVVVIAVEYAGQYLDGTPFSPDLQLYCSSLWKLNVRWPKTQFVLVGCVHRPPKAPQCRNVAVSRKEVTDSEIATVCSSKKKTCETPSGGREFSASTLRNGEGVHLACFIR